MPNNDNDGAHPQPSVDRRELERIAFARPQTDADAAAAENALRQLMDADQTDAVPATPAEPQVEAAHGPTDVTTDLGPAGPPFRSRRRIVALIVGGSLLIGLGAGVEIERATTTTTASEPSGTRTFSVVVPGAVGRGDSAAAAARLATAQTSTDVFPVPNFSVSLGLEPKTVHLILTSPDGNSLWIGRTSAAICLLFSDPLAELANDDLDPSIADAGSNCASTEAFQKSGLTVRNGPDSWTWDGVTFTETATG